MESASARNSYTRDGDSWSAQVKSTKLVGSTGRGPRLTAEIIHLNSDDENVQGTYRQSRAIEEVDRNVIDLERLDHVTSALSDVTVKEHKNAIGEDRIDKEEEMEYAEEMEEAEEMDEEEIEEVEDPADSVPLASLFLKPLPTPSPHIVHPPKRKPGVIYMPLLMCWIVRGGSLRVRTGPLIDKQPFACHVLRVLVALMFLLSS